MEEAVAQEKTEATISLRRTTAVLFTIVVFASLAAAGWAISRVNVLGQERGEAACQAIIAVRNALVAASTPDKPPTAEEAAQRKRGLAAFDAQLQPSIDQLCPTANLKIGGSK
jgi:hypothetical protein